MKKNLGYIIILQMSTINDSHMMYGSSAMECNGHNFCHFGLFVPFYCPDNPIIQNFEKMRKKNTWRYYHFVHVYHKWQSYDVWFLNMKRDGHNFFSFWTIFCPFTPLTTQKINFEKLKKTPRDIILHMCPLNDNHMMRDSWDIECDGQIFLSF